MEQLLPDKEPGPTGCLDVSILHSLVLERLLGIDTENMASQKNLTYTALGRGGGGFAVRQGREPVLLPPQPHPGGGDRPGGCQNGEKMPQKSTYFYPKADHRSGDERPERNPKPAGR